MPNLYYSLVASLPSFRMMDTPPLSYRKFLESCNTLMNRHDFDVLTKLTLGPGVFLKDFEAAKEEPSSSQDDFFKEVLKQFPSGSLAEKYMLFEISLRNILLKLRMQKLGVSTQNLTPSCYNDIDGEHAARLCYAVQNPWEREKMLDMMRWRKIEELERENTNHFRFDTVCAYSLRLQIAWKWVARNHGDSNSNLNAAAVDICDRYQKNKEHI